MDITQRLSLGKEQLKNYGEVVVLYASLDQDGNAPYFLDGEGDNEKGMGLRLTKETAVKLAWNLLKMVGETRES